MNTQNMKPISGAPMPKIRVPKVGGGTIEIGAQNKWQMLYVYRGKHCPLCRKFLGEFNEVFEKFIEAGIEVAAVSADTLDKAEAEAKEDNWRFPLGYDLSVDQMRELGVYISSPRSPEETDRPFAEPALFVVNPENNMQIISLSTSPAVRPNLDILLVGIKFAMDKNLPPRGKME